ARQDVDEANRTLSTFFVITCGVVAVVAPLGYLFAGVAPRLFNVPSGNEQGFRWVIFALIVAFLVALINNIFDSVLWAKSRFDIRAVIELTGLVVRNGSIVLLFTLIRP